MRLPPYNDRFELDEAQVSTKKSAARIRRELKIS
jgi:hypothetical protein